MIFEEFLSMTISGCSGEALADFFRIFGRNDRLRSFFFLIYGVIF